MHRYAKGVDAPEDPFTSMDPEFKKYIEEQKLAREREERREAGEEIYDELRAAEPKFAGLHTPDQIKPGFGNTFMNEGYSWVQDLESVEFRFVVPVGTKARELNIRLSPHHIFIEVKSGFHGILLDKELECVSIIISLRLLFRFSLLFILEASASIKCFLLFQTPHLCWIKF